MVFSYLRRQSIRRGQRVELLGQARVSGGHDGGRDAGVEQRTAGAAVVIERRRQRPAPLCMARTCAIMSSVSSRRSSLNDDLAPPPGLERVDRPALHGDAQHLFQAEGLGAELNIVVAPLPPRPVLVFDRDNAPIGVELHHVAFSLQSPPLGPERQRTLHPDAVFHARVRLIRPLVGVPTRAG